MRAQIRSEPLTRDLTAAVKTATTGWRRATTSGGARRRACRRNVKTARTLGLAREEHRVEAGDARNTSRVKGRRIRRRRRRATRRGGSGLRRDTGDGMGHRDTYKRHRRNPHLAADLRSFSSSTKRRRRARSTAAATLGAAALGSSS